MSDWYYSISIRSEVAPQVIASSVFHVRNRGYTWLTYVHADTPKAEILAELTPMRNDVRVFWADHREALTACMTVSELVATGTDPLDVPNVHYTSSALARAYHTVEEAIAESFEVAS